MSYIQQSNIKSWAEEDRPREKLLLKGHHVLSDAELLAILLGSGTKNCSAVELARTVLSVANNNLNQLGRISLEQLVKINGIGEAKAITILAALELGRRRQKTDALQIQTISGSKQAYELLAPCIADLPHEEFWMIFLNRKNAVLKYYCITKGGFTGTIVDARQVFLLAIQEHATAVILAHNHPGGSLYPSDQDISVTANLVKAGKILDIIVSDHIIITNNGYYSFAEKGKL